MSIKSDLIAALDYVWHGTKYGTWVANDPALNGVLVNSPTVDATGISTAKLTAPTAKYALATGNAKTHRLSSCTWVVRLRRINTDFGAVIKIGWPATFSAEGGGWGWGFGGGTVDTAGDEIVYLRDGLAWHPFGNTLTPPVGVFASFTLRLTATGATMHVGDSLAGTSVGLPSSYGGTPQVQFGGYRFSAGSRFSSVKILDVMQFTRDLTSNERLWLADENNNLDTLYDVNNKSPVSVWIPSRDTAGNGTTTLTDLVGSNNGTLTNMDPATDWVVSDGKTALDFDGTNDYVSVPSSTTLNVPNAITVSAWFYANTSPGDNQGIVAKWRTASPADGRQYNIGLGPGRLPFGGISSSGTFEASNFITSPTAVSALVWNHVVLVFVPGVSIGLYVNGALATSSATTATTLFQGTAPLTIGHQANLSISQLFFNGKIDDVRIFSQALSASDVSYLHKGGLGRGRQWKVEPFDVNGKKPVAVWCESRDPEPTSSTIVTDLIGTNNGTMTLMDPVTDRVADTGAGGIRALDFDGVNDEVVCGSSGLVGQSFSISGWVYQRSLTANPAIVRLVPATGNEFIFQPTNRAFSDNANAANLLFRSNPVLNSWNHFVMTFSANSYQFFQNGVLELSGTFTVPLTVGTNSVRIGRRTSTVDGRIDDVRIFNQVLTLADVSYLYAGGFGRGIRASVGSPAAAIRFFHGF